MQSAADLGFALIVEQREREVERQAPGTADERHYGRSQAGTSSSAARLASPTSSQHRIKPFTIARPSFISGRSNPRPSSNACLEQLAGCEEIALGLQRQREWQLRSSACSSCRRQRSADASGVDCNGCGAGTSALVCSGPRASAGAKRSRRGGNDPVGQLLQSDGIWG